MNEQPLQPFPSPSEVFSHFPVAVSTGAVVEWVLLGILVLWVLYTLVAVYHWLKYSHGSAMMYPAIGIHLGVSIILMGFAFTGAFL